jgi:hypothetical protein
LNGVSVCEISKNLERPYPDHYWRQTLDPNLRTFPSL